MEYMNKIKRFLEMFLRLLFLPIMLLIPAKRNIWIFGSLYGNAFNDNSKYFYLYVLNNHPEIKPIWLYKDSNIKKEIDSYQGISYSIWSLKGIYYSIIARYIFTSYGIYDVNPVFSSPLKLVELWHGIPLRNLNFNRSKFQDFKQVIFFRKPSGLISTSKFVNKKLNKIFNLKPKRIFVTGYPRNDYLLNDNDYDIPNNIKNKIRNKQIIFYLPTWRINEVDLFHGYGFNSNELQEYLKNNNMILIIKAHHMTNKFNLSKKYDNIIFLGSKDLIDVYPLLKKTDILITDYSSVYIDFLLLQKPIIFAPFDYNSLPISYFDCNYYSKLITPGEKIYNWNQLIKVLDKLKKRDSFKVYRKMSLDYFYKYKDSSSCKRLFNILIKK